MSILIGFLIVVEIIVSILLILVILVQPSKSGGLGGAAFGAGGGVGEQLFGARTGNVLTKATIVLASIFLLNTLLLAFLYSQTDPVARAVPSPVLTAPEEGGMVPGGVPEAPSAEGAEDAGGDAGDDGEPVSGNIEMGAPPPSAEEVLPGPVEDGAPVE
jgi:preprotein translocase subunit SecG